jgi:hypothetical protein
LNLHSFKTVSNQFEKAAGFARRLFFVHRIAGTDNRFFTGLSTEFGVETSLFLTSACCLGNAAKICANWY